MKFFAEFNTHEDDVRIYSTKYMLDMPVETCHGVSLQKRHVNCNLLRPPKQIKKRGLLHPRFFHGRRGKNRTLTDGFGDHCSTIKLLS